MKYLLIKIINLNFYLNMAENNHLLHVKSSQIIDGEPKLPTPDQIEYGEIAINYADGKEKISLKSSSNNIKTFSTDEQNEAKFALKSRVEEIDEVVSKAFDTMNKSCGFNEEITYVPQNELINGCESLSEAMEVVAEKSSNNYIDIEKLKTDKANLDEVKNRLNSLADNEDIESINNSDGYNVLKLADREYDEANFSGKGYKILRKNISDGKNILTQEMINDANTVYEIRYDFDLNGTEITIPEGCTLKFNGGSLCNGTLIGNNTIIYNYIIDFSIKCKTLNKFILHLIINTTNELKKASLLEGCIVTTLGYYKTNDNGGATFEIVSETTNDGEFYIPILGGKYAKYIANGDIRASQFGARTFEEDGITPFNSTSALQSAIDFITRRNSGFVDNRTINRALILESSYYTDTLNINTSIAIGNPPLTIKGYGIWKSALYYYGEDGYKGIFTTEEELDDSSILRVNAGNNLHIEGIAFYGGHWENGKPISYASHCVFIDGALDEGFYCRNCLFASAIRSGITVKTGAWNFHLHELRFDNTGKDCVAIRGEETMSFVMTDFTVDCVVAKVDSGSLAIDFLKPLPWVQSDGYVYSIYNSLLYIHKGISDTKIQIASARLEGKPKGYNDNPACLIKFDTADHGTVIELNNLDDSLSTKDCIIAIDKPGLSLPTVIGRISNSYTQPMFKTKNDMFMNASTELGVTKPCQLFYPRYSDHTIAGGDMSNAHDIKANYMTSLFGKGMFVKSVIYDQSIVKYGDIIWRDRQVDGIYRTDRYSDKHIGYICVYPHKGFARNYYREQMQTVEPIDFISIGNDYIQTSLPLKIYWSYTLTYDNGEFDDFMCTDTIKQDDGSYFNYFKFDVFKTYRTVSKICVSGAIWKPFGDKQLNTYFGKTNERKTDMTDETSTMFFDTDLHMPLYLEKNTWLTSNGILADTLNYLDSRKTLTVTPGTIIYDNLRSCQVYRTRNNTNYEITFTNVNLVNGCDITLTIDNSTYILPIPTKYYTYYVSNITDGAKLCSYIDYTYGSMYFQGMVSAISNNKLILRPIDGLNNHVINIEFSNSEIEGSVTYTPNSKTDVYKCLDTIPVNIKRIGTFDEKPTFNFIYPGFTYYDITNKQLLIANGRHRCFYRIIRGSSKDGLIKLLIDSNEVSVNIIANDNPNTIMTKIKESINLTLSEFYSSNVNGGQLIIEAVNEKYPVIVEWENDTDAIIELTSHSLLNGKWVNINGETIDVKKYGTFSQKPSSNLGIQIGFSYFCTDKQTIEGQENGIMIYHKGNDVWVDALGRIIN